MVMCVMRINDIATIEVTFELSERWLGHQGGEKLRAREKGEVTTQSKKEQVWNAGDDMQSTFIKQNW